MNDFQYVVKRSDRKSFCVRILEDNMIIVNCPKRSGVEAIEKFLESKSGWIKRHLNDNNRKNEFLAEVISCKKVLVAGEPVPLHIDRCGDNFISFCEVRVKSQSCLKKLYISEFSTDFGQIIDNVCAQTSLSYRKYSFRDYKSRWGCCNLAGEIKFNWKLLMLPREIWRYVIIHELCHTVYMNHSPRFYKLMSTFLPEYGNLKKELEKYSRIAKLY